jgi:hypothetical protein
MNLKCLAPLLQAGQTGGTGAALLSCHGMTSVLKAEEGPVSSCPLPAYHIDEVGSYNMAIGNVQNKKTYMKQGGQVMIAVGALRCDEQEKVDLR